MFLHRAVHWRDSKVGLCGGLKILRYWFDPNSLHQPAPTMGYVEWSQVPTAGLMKSPVHTEGYINAGVDSLTITPVVQ